MEYYRERLWYCDYPTYLKLCGLLLARYVVIIVFSVIDHYLETLQLVYDLARERVLFLEDSL